MRNHVGHIGVPKPYKKSATLVHQISRVGVERSCFIKQIWPLVTWVKTLFIFNDLHLSFFFATLDGFDIVFPSSMQDDACHIWTWYMAFLANEFSVPQLAEHSVFGSNTNRDSDFVFVPILVRNEFNKRIQCLISLQCNGFLTLADYCNTQK